ncbi:unnamed protein product [Oncorhynchus mykiss]|uniref:R3H domain-containing protein n=1 Tax=Oncorhynchus mykiss TaxID=8022 RepID=A0A060Y8E9_ONCMY|nr:unnamed protein product [Oncorhynchus mykiss]
MLDDEESTDSELRSKFSQRWNRTPSGDLYKPLRAEGGNFRSVLDKAVQADQVVRERYNAHCEMIALLCKPEAELTAAIPSANPAKTLQGSEVRDSPGLRIISREFSERMSEAIVPESSGLRSCNELCPSALPSSPPLATEDECHHDNRKVEQQKPVSNQGQPARKRTKAKGRLVRSMAVCEESFPPSPPDTTQDSQSSVEVTMLPGCHDNDEEEQSKEPNVPTLIISDTSQEYTDSTGIDLHQFIITTLNSNPRDRMMLLKLEQDMIDFITDNSPYKKFPHMSSYHRMLVHRVAAYFGMEHNVDQTGKSVIINSTSNTRIPEQRFMDYVQEERGEETQWRTILKRDNAEDNQARLHPLREERRSKSMEEREEEYQRARERIFNQEPACPQETRSIEDGSPHAATQRRQLFRGTRGNSGSSRQSSTETDYSRYSNWSSTDSGRYSNDPRPWSSTDSDSAYQRPAPKARPANHSWDARGACVLLLYYSVSYLSTPKTCHTYPGHTAYRLLSCRSQSAADLPGDDEFAAASEPSPKIAGFLSTWLLPPMWCNTGWCGGIVSPDWSHVAG